MPGFVIDGQIKLQAVNISQVTNQIRSALQGLNTNINIQVAPNAATSITIVHTRLQALIPTLAGVTLGAKNAAQALNQMAGVFAGIQLNSNQMTAGITQAANSLNAVKTSTIEASSAVERFGEQTGKLGTRFLAFSVAAAAVIGIVRSLREGIGQAINFNTEMIKLTQIGETSSAALKTLSDDAARLSQQYGISAVQIARTAVELRQAGKSMDEVRLIIEAVSKANLSPAFKDMGATVNTIIAIMNQFQVPASGIEKSLDGINTVALRFGTNISEIGQTITHAGTAFKQAGGNVDELVAIFAAARASTRESADNIANSIRMIFERVPRGETIALLDQLGIHLRDANGQFVGPIESIRRLSAALEGIPTTDLRFQRIAEAIGGLRSADKAVAIIQSFPEALKAYEAAQRGANTVSNSAELALHNLDNRITLLKRQWDDFTRRIESSASFQNVAKAALDFASALIKISDALIPLLPLISTLAAFKIGSSLAPFLGGFLRGAAAPPRGFAGGGLVPGTGNTDNFPAMLQPGEYVLRKDAVQAIGVENLHDISKFQLGGEIGLRKNRSIGQVVLTPGGDREGRSSTKVSNSSKVKETFIGRFGKELGANAVSIADKVLSNYLARAYVRTYSVSKGHSDRVSRIVSEGAAPEIDRRIINLVGPIKKSIKEDPAFIRGMEGYVFEAYLSAISGITSSGGTDPIDFPDLSADAKKAIQSLFGNQDIRLRSSWIDAKRSPVGNPEVIKKGLDANLFKTEDIYKALGDKIRDYRLTGKEVKDNPNFLTDVIVEASPKVKPARRAQGGEIDSVPALLTPGEYVINREAARRIGYANLEKMNRAQKFQAGGVVGGAAVVGGLLISQLGGLEGQFGKATQELIQFTAQVGTAFILIRSITGAYSANLRAVEESAIATRQATIAQIEAKQNAQAAVKAQLQTQLTAPGISQQDKVTLTASIADINRETAERQKNISNLDSEIVARQRNIQIINGLSIATNIATLAIATYTAYLSSQATKQQKQGEDTLKTAHSAAEFAKAQKDLEDAARTSGGASGAQIGTTAGGGVGSVLGGFVGSFFGPVVGTAIGAAIGNVAGQALGGVIGKFFGSRNADVSEVQNRVRDAHFDQIIRDVGKTVTQLNAGKIDPSQAQKDLSSRRTELDALIKGAPEEQRKILSERKEAEFIPREEEVASKRAAKALAEAQSTLAGQIAQVSELFTRLGGVVESATIKFNQVEAGLTHFAGALTGRASPIRIGGELTALGTGDTEGFNKAVNYALGPFGNNPFAQSFSSRLQGANVLSYQLPDILRQASVSETPAKSFETNLQEILHNTPGLTKGIVRDISDVINTTVTPANRAEQIRLFRNEPEKASEDIINKTDIKKDFQTFQKIYQDLIKTQNDTAKLYGEYNQIIEHIATIQDKLATVSQQRLEFEARQFTTAAGRPSAFFDVFTRQQAQFAFTSQQTRLTGIPGGGGVEQITARLRDTFTRIRTTEQQVETGATPLDRQKAQQALDDLTSKSNNLQKALENLANTSNRLSDIQARLAELDRRRDARYGLAERVATANPQELLRIRQDVALTQQVATRPELFNARAEENELRARVIQFAGRSPLPISQLGINPNTTPFGNVTGEELVRRLLAASPAFPRGYTEGEVSGEAATRRELIQEERQIFLEAQNAQFKLAGILTTQNNIFLVQLRAAFNEFIEKWRASGVPGIPQAHAAGGPIFSPRGGDTVPAMLTPGEFIVNSRSASANRGLLSAINRGARYFQEGGDVEPDEHPFAPSLPPKPIVADKIRQSGFTGGFGGGTTQTPVDIPRLAAIAPPNTPQPTPGFLFPPTQLPSTGGVLPGFGGLPPAREPIDPQAIQPDIAKANQRSAINEAKDRATQAALDAPEVVKTPQQLLQDRVREERAAARAEARTDINEQVHAFRARPSPGREDLERFRATKGERAAALAPQLQEQTRIAALGRAERIAHPEPVAKISDETLESIEQRKLGEQRDSPKPGPRNPLYQQFLNQARELHQQELAQRQIAREQQVQESMEARERKPFTSPFGIAARLRQRYIATGRAIPDNLLEAQGQPSVGLRDQRNLVSDLYVSSGLIQPPAEQPLVGGEQRRRGAQGVQGRVGGDNQIATMQQQIAYLAGQVQALQAQLNQRRTGINRAMGGPISGPQGTDKVPAWLTHGEFVINAEATKKHYNLLKAINSSTGGGSNDSGMMKSNAFQAGGAVGGGGGHAGGANFGEFGSHVNAFVQATNTFRDAVTSLRDVHIPSEINIRREGQVTVLLNGAEVLASIKGDLGTYISGEIAKHFQNMKDQVQNSVTV